MFPHFKFVVNHTINLINETHHNCKKSEHNVTVLQKYTIITCKLVTKKKKNEISINVSHIKVW